MTNQSNTSRGLTETQRRLLVEVASGDDGCIDTYGPAIRLVELGLLVWRSDFHLALTDAGRAALSNGEVPQS